MEERTMALARLSDNVFPSFPSMFERFFEGDMMDWNGGNFADRNATLPAVNVIENDDEYRIEVAAPGLKKSDFNLNFENGRLTISSERKDERQEKSGDRFNRREFWYQSFQRSFTLPENVVNTGKISARYEDGILYITLPKRDEVKPKPAKAIKIT